MAGKRLRVLLLCDDQAGAANTIFDHIDAFRRFSRHRISTFNPKGMRGSVALDLDGFDVAVIHYSLILMNERYVSEGFRDKIRRFDGLKVQFIQDEYRWVERTAAATRDAGVNVLFTVAPEPAASALYEARLPGVRRVLTLTGYVPEGLEAVAIRPLSDRPWDVGYRGRDLPFWLGRLSQEKTWIAQGFAERAPAYGLKTDIAWRERDRIYGHAWTDFIASCRATLCTESGASIADFDGSAEAAVTRYLRHHPGATFAEVSGAVLRPYEGNVVVNVISPRVFEAVALGTALVMYPGEYSGIVRPGEHYIPLEKDYSNMDEVVASLRDEAQVAELTRRAHEDLIRSRRWSYESFVSGFDDVVDEECEGAPRGRSFPARLGAAKIERALRVPPPSVRALRFALAVVSAASGQRFTGRSDEETGELLAKARLAVWSALGDRHLRPIFREGLRARMAWESLLDEILELALLRRAARGRLRTRDPFRVSTRFDAHGGTLRFISVPPEGPARPANGASEEAREAVRSGRVTEIVWDHTALGGRVRLTRPEIEIGIGAGGLKSYALLAQIGRRRPRLLDHALGPIIGSE